MSSFMSFMPLWFKKNFMSFMPLWFKKNFMSFMPLWFKKNFMSSFMSFMVNKNFYVLSKLQLTLLF
jgi:hypothetical protein